MEGLETGRSANEIGRGLMEKGDWRGAKEDWIQIWEAGKELET